MSTTEISAVVAPGPLLPAGDAHARRYREFHVKPASVIDGSRTVDVRGLGGVGYRVQLGLTFAGTPIGTPADRILDTLASCRLVIELIAADRLTIGWEGPRWHVRYAEGVAFDGACRVGEPGDAHARPGDELELRHSEGREVISWAEVADFAAFVNRGLELDRSILLLAGSLRGPPSSSTGARNCGTSAASTTPRARPCGPKRTVSDASKRSSWTDSSHERIPALSARRTRGARLGRRGRRHPRRACSRCRGVATG
ncbi:hypothetical protein [Homoserinibacter gongjuensis]|uniref:Uncharacterized protein n=1 Tax=Homoserinibacter gongjuensis TaxID=1162968 RepID=A0ABQ6JTQ6_9MICO|nr:hypothetical protein [Homoserinibacter gongjuensis]GMA91102.1 hypothetical protein GCM10025869_16310 [Homoserinibacter gongjuensis]